MLASSIFAPAKGGGFRGEVRYRLLLPRQLGLKPAGGISARSGPPALQVFPPVLHRGKSAGRYLVCCNTSEFG
jgi:hypothetical protein